MLLKLPITFARCLKYLCFASKTVVQSLISGPYLYEKTHIICICKLHIKLLFQLIFMQVSR